MTLMNSSQASNRRLQAIYAAATRGLPNDADRRLTVDELLALAANGALGSRQNDAVMGLAVSSDQAMMLRLLADTQALSSELADDLRSARQPSTLDRLRGWWRLAGMPPVFASAGIALMAVIGFQFLGSTPRPVLQAGLAPAQEFVEAPMFGGAFEASDRLFAASLEPGEQSDQLFDGDFDS